MAAIVSQLAANNRKRLATKHTWIPNDKCVYTIQPFDAHYDPRVSENEGANAVFVIDTCVNHKILDRCPCYMQPDNAGTA